MAFAVDCTRGSIVSRVAAPMRATASGPTNTLLQSSFLSAAPLRSFSSPLLGPVLPINGDAPRRRSTPWPRSQASTAEASPEASSATRLKQLYSDRVRKSLLGKEGFANPQRVPRLTKIVINCGLGEASDDAKSLASTLQDLSTIAGQKAVVTRAKKAIAGFNIRKDVPVGVCVTLRGEAMFAFLDRLINLALPRIRDFQGLKTNSFDGRGNFHLGLQEQLMFPEIDYDQVQKVRGMDVSFVTTALNNDEGLQLMTALGMPFQGLNRK